MASAAGGGSSSGPVPSQRPVPKRRSTSSTLTGTHHPVVVRLHTERSEDLQLRLADRITAFAGSMSFVYIHVLLFAGWMIWVEKSPWPTLTLAVSLEAIFLSTFVLIGQNRQAAFQQAKADHDFAEEEQELRVNTQLTREIHELTREVHQRIVGTTSSSGGGNAPAAEAAPGA
ncbi:MAG TPA: DUF1003 domain-containing protein [Candidatus Dormibacteraeota bacterium]|nr:DUF1003 domain-containing protein [Candidatus Dormibacteraeota bacterium]